uniref:Uncharacterized protein n=1 Tax=Micrurus surinamensis TaxID=129470 RepID=A0A2D4NK12_MICSU
MGPKWVCYTSNVSWMWKGLSFHIWISLCLLADQSKISDRFSETTQIKAERQLSAERTGPLDTKMALEMFSALRFMAVGKLLRNAFQLLSLTFCNGMLYILYILCVYFNPEE